MQTSKIKLTDEMKDMLLAVQIGPHKLAAVREVDIAPECRALEVVVEDSEGRCCTCQVSEEGVVRKSTAVGYQAHASFLYAAGSSPSVCGPITHNPELARGLLQPLLHTHEMQNAFLAWLMKGTSAGKLSGNQAEALRYFAFHASPSEILDALLRTLKLCNADGEVFLQQTAQPLEIKEELVKLVRETCPKEWTESELREMTAASLFSLGFDSMSVVDLTHRIDDAFLICLNEKGKDIAHCTLDEICDVLLQKYNVLDPKIKVADNPAWRASETYCLIGVVDRKAEDDRQVHVTLRVADHKLRSLIYETERRTNTVTDPGVSVYFDEAGKIDRIMVRDDLMDRVEKDC